MTIELLTPQHNFAVCKLDERKFPGVVFQGDSLFSLYCLLQRALKELQAKSVGQNEDLETEIYVLEAEVEKLGWVLDLYEKTSRENGYDLPYFRPD